MSDTAPMYTEEYQALVLSYMLHNPQFRDIAAEAMSKDDFSNRALQWYFTTIASSEYPLSSVTLREELLRAVQTKQVREADFDKLDSVYKVLKRPPLPTEERHIQDTFSKFIRTQSMKRAILDSLDLIRNEEWDAVLEQIEAARLTGMDILTIGHQYFPDFKNRLAERASRGEARKLSTGIPELDTVLYGGIKTKQLGLCIGGSGRGKSIFLEWLARVAVMLGQQVVYYTMELSEEDVADRFDSLFYHVRPQELQSQQNDLFERMHQYHQRFGNNLIIKGYSEGEASIRTIKAHYKQLTSIGVRPGLVLIDYLDLMKPHIHYTDVNQEQKKIVEACRGMAKDFDTRVWSALQLNRSGLTMETPDESGLAGSISRLYTADAVLAMAQTPSEREEQLMRLLVMKNRNGPAPRTVRVETDFAFMTFYKGSVQTTALQSGQAQADPATWEDNDDGELAGVDEETFELLQVEANESGDVILD